MIFEDVHWIDPTNLEVLSRAVDRLRTLGVLLIITYRPEFEPPGWEALRHRTHSKSARRARNRWNDRPRYGQQGSPREY